MPKIQQTGKHHIKAVVLDDFEKQPVCFTKTAAHVGDTVTIKGETWIITSLPVDPKGRRVMLGDFPNLEDSIDDAIRKGATEPPLYYIAWVERLEVQ